MIEIFYTLQPVDSHELLFRILKEFFGLERQALLFNKCGKPYLSGNPVCFSISHSGALTAVAVAKQNVGLDVEFTQKKRNYRALFSRLSPDEQKEIKSDNDFLRHWTLKESFIK